MVSHTPSLQIYASLLVRSGPNSERWASEMWPALASFPDPQTPIQICLIIFTNVHRFACSLIYETITSSTGKSILSMMFFYPTVEVPFDFYSSTAMRILPMTAFLVDSNGGVWEERRVEHSYAPL